MKISDVFMSLFTKLSHRAKVTRRNRPLLERILEELEDRTVPAVSVLNSSGSVAGYTGMNLFDGATGNVPFDPPDTCGAAGPDVVVSSVNQGVYVETVNQAIAIFSKDSGTSYFTPVDLPDFFFNVGGLSQVSGGGVSDAFVCYDELIGRFIVGDLNLSNPDLSQDDRLNLAVSLNSNPQSATTADWRFFQVNTTENTTNKHGTSSSSYAYDYNEDFPDNVGYNADGFVCSLNMNNIDNPLLASHVQIVTVNAADLTPTSSSSTIITPAIHQIDDFNHQTLRPVTMHDDTSGGLMWFITEDWDPTTQVANGQNIDVVALTHLDTTPILSDFVLPVQAYRGGANFELGVNSVFEPGSSGDQLLTNEIGTGIQKAAEMNDTIVACQTVSYHLIGQDGANFTNPTVAAQVFDSVRWYSIDVSTSLPVINQEGDISAGVGTYDTYPSIDINQYGDIGMTYIQTRIDSSNEYLSMYVTGRSHSDPNGTMQPGILVQAGTGSGDLGGQFFRAGDLSGINVDPTDETTFWAANEFAASGLPNPNLMVTSDGEWGTAIANFSITASGAVSTSTSVSASLSTLTYGTVDTFTATVTPASGTATGSVDFFDDTTGAFLGSSALSGSTASLVTTPNQMQVAATNHTIEAIFIPASPTSFFSSEGTVGGIAVSPQNLTITATANTKLYDASVTAAASPTVSGLIGSDTVSAGELYANANAGTGKTLSVSFYIVSDNNGGLDYTVTTANNTGGRINKANLTITASEDTKAYDATTTAVAVPTVAGLLGGDSVTGLGEVFSSSTVGTGKTISVSAYTVNDGNSGNNYTVTTANSTTGMIQSSTTHLQVVSVTLLPDGFTVTFNQPFNPADVTMYGANLTTVENVTMHGSTVGPIHGSLIIDPSYEMVTFKATASYLELLNSIFSGNNLPTLPDDTYTIDLVAGTGSNGFQGTSGSHLDGHANGTTADYTTTYSTNYQTSGTPTLSIPDFSRGPDSGNPIKVPNDTAAGIPITLYSASGVSDVIFSLDYNSSLLTISSALSGGASDASDPNGMLTLIGNVGGIATFHFQDTSAQSGNIVLGDIQAVVPDSAASIYGAKEFLYFSRIVINASGGNPVAGASSIHVNAYFGDVFGVNYNSSHTSAVLVTVAITGTNTTTVNTDTWAENNVAQGYWSGFTGFALVDSAIVGDVCYDFSIDAGDVSCISSYVALLSPDQIPLLPTGLTYYFSESY